MLAAISFPDISPIIFSVEIFGFNLALRWYAMAYIVGIGFGWLIIRAALRRPQIWRNGPPMQVGHLEDLLTYIVIGVIAGGRLGYVLFYKPQEYLANPFDILKIWEGGLAFHGGFVGVVLGVYLFSRRHNVPLPDLADIIAVAATPAILLVRCANFINAELWGRPTDAPWGVIFPGVEAQSCATATEPCVRHPSQLYEAGLEGLILGIILLTLAFRFGALKRPWLLSAVFFLGYGLSRFIVEFVRQPDLQFTSPDNPLGLALHTDGYGLTMGQLLSLPMILAGFAVILFVLRR
ncbi:prolipoprotein diacylglyceryl transferase [Yoonia sp. 2307UL14-13]|uniref:prolipoprotein diacylglyceryl transferase n=1 Tax=Yoonia sp. 2307UL14-13 TaxID=3126506 RepID=UPI0030B787D1